MPTASLLRRNHRSIENNSAGPPEAQFKRTRRSVFGDFEAIRQLQWLNRVQAAFPLP